MAAAGNLRLFQAAFVRRALAKLACSLCRGNAGVYAGSMSRLLRVAESRVQAWVGEIVAVEEWCACVCRLGRCSAQVPSPFNMLYPVKVGRNNRFVTFLFFAPYMLAAFAHAVAPLLWQACNTPRHKCYARAMCISFLPSSAATPYV